MTKLLRFLLIAIVVLVLLVVAAAYIVPRMIDDNTLRELAQKAVKEQTGGDLRIDGPLRLSILPKTNLGLHDVSLLMPDESEPVFSARKAAISADLLPLILSRKLSVGGIELDGLNLVLKSGTDAKPVVSTDGMNDKQLEAFYARQREAKQAAAKEAAEQAGQALALPVLLNAGKFLLTDSRIRYVDEIAKTTTDVHIDELRATQLNAQGKAFPLSLTMSLNPENAQERTDLTTDGQISLDMSTRVADLKDLRIKVKSATLAEVDVTINGTYDVVQAIADVALAVDSVGVKGGGTVRYAANESPQIDARLKFNKLNPALIVVAGPEAGASEQAPTTGSDAIPFDTLRSLDNRVSIEIDNAEFDTLTVSQMKLKARAVEGVIKISELKGEVYGGQLDASGELNARLSTAKMALKGALHGLDIEQAVTAQSIDLAVSGKANLDFNVTSAGKTFTQLRTHLDGPVSFKAPGVDVKDVAVEKMFCQAVALINKETLSASFSDNTVLNTVSADLQFAKGKANLEPLVIAADNLGMRGTGYLDLTSLQFRADLRAALSTKLKENDNACRINKRMENIEWPVRCKGLLTDSPAQWCRIDSGDILEQMLKQQAGDRLKKEGSKLLKGLFGDDKKDG